GVLQGEFSLMEKGQVRLDFLPADSRLLAGDLVVTSGVGGYYPSGLVIGTIDEVRLNDSGSAPYAILTPQSDVSGLTQVAIIKSFDIVT
ncbi:MAG: rod shape-determining protein MreC, partial [Oscillibacter sp.]|nr:rod shape-determining protein MreC [Oscillibacter sp.]